MVGDGQHRAGMSLGELATLDHREQGGPTITVFAREVADTVVFMDGGVVVEAGSPSEGLSNPRHERTRVSSAE